ncbi:MAG: PilN domain-containing protein [Gammaproteobacteria bacterium]
MAKINLLPWREAQRTERARQFKLMAGGAALAAAGLIAVSYFAVEAQIQVQTGRNDYLKAEIKGLEKLLNEKRKLREEEKNLRNRMNVIEDLQFSRPLAVYLFDSLARLVPQDVFLTSVTQTAAAVKIEGISTSATSVSDFMRRLDDSPRFGKPTLESITGKQGGSVPQNSFTLTVNQVIQKPDNTSK